MRPFTSRQLYIMNGGNKLYIHKDGFGDVYEATPEQEAMWAQEVIANALEKIDAAADIVEVNSAVENLLFHQHEGLHALLLSKMQHASPARKAALASALLTARQTEKTFDAVEILYPHLVERKNDCAEDLFLTLRNLKNDAAKLFVLKCLEGEDHELAVKATITLEIWAYSGMPALRQNNLLGMLQPENKQSAGFQTALGQLRTIFQTTTNA